MNGRFGLRSGGIVHGPRRWFGRSSNGMSKLRFRPIPRMRLASSRPPPVPVLFLPAASLVGVAGLVFNRLVMAAVLA